MIAELDIVALTTNLPQHRLTVGDVGAVVHVYDSNDAYEVEFVTGSGRTVAVITVADSDVRPIQNDEILHVRGLAA